MRNLFGFVPVIVYQMAKVGSSAVVAALQAARLPVFHVHRMNIENLRKMREVRPALGWVVPAVPAHDQLGLRLREKVIRRRCRAAIVTMIRDPIARNLSSYFEHLDFIWRTENAHEVVSLEHLIDGFHTRYPHDEVLTWFEDEMLPVTGIDVYQHPFPSCGHSVVQHENLDLLILKTELSNDSKTLALSEFGAHVQLVNVTNTTAAKPKGVVYKQFLRAIRLDRFYVEKMLGSRYVRHFYNEQEREQLAVKYSTRT